jgi:hypothetical protein
MRHFVMYRTGTALRSRRTIRERIRQAVAALLISALPTTTLPLEAQPLPVADRSVSKNAVRDVLMPEGGLDSILRAHQTSRGACVSDGWRIMQRIGQLTYTSRAMCQTFSGSKATNLLRMLKSSLGDTHCPINEGLRGFSLLGKRIIEVAIQVKRIFRQPPYNFSAKRNPQARVVAEVRDKLHHTLELDTELLNRVGVCIELIQDVHNMVF